MRFRRKTLAGMQERIGQLGMSQCGVCSSGEITVHKRPGLVTFGGLHHDRDDPRWDSEANVLFMVMTECNLCGNTLFFNSERFVPGSEKSMVVGMTEEEEQAREAEVDGA